MIVVDASSGDQSPRSDAATPGDKAKIAMTAAADAQDAVIQTRSIRTRAAGSRSRSRTMRSYVRLPTSPSANTYPTKGTARTRPRPEKSGEISTCALPSLVHRPAPARTWTLELSS